MRSGVRQVVAHHEQSGGKFVRPVSPALKTSERRASVVFKNQLARIVCSVWKRTFRRSAGDRYAPRLGFLSFGHFAFAASFGEP